MKMKNKLLILGYGYTAQILAASLDSSKWIIYGTSRSKTNDPYCSIINYAKPEIQKALESSTHILVSIAPNENGDVIYQDFQDIIAHSKYIKWIGYLSSTVVYGNHDGAWVDETTTTKPEGKRGIQRLLAENQWINFGKKEKKAVNVFRLSGIYGKDRNALKQVSLEKARSINKPKQVFSRIHVEDTANIIKSAMQHFSRSAIYNLADDYPCSSIEVNNYAASLLKTTPPKIIDYEAADLPEMAKEFYKSNRRISNQKIKNELGINLIYPTYKEGILKLFKDRHY